MLTFRGGHRSVYELVTATSNSGGVTSTSGTSLVSPPPPSVPRVPPVAVALPPRLAPPVEPSVKLLAGSTTPKIPADPDQLVWKELRGAIAPLRAKFDYLEVKRLIAEARPRMEAKASQVAVDDLVMMIDRIIVGESAIRAFLKSRIFTVHTQDQSGSKISKTLTRLSGNEGILIDSKGAESRMLRVNLRIPWIDLLSQSLADQKTSEGAEITAACLWFWGDHRAAAAMDKLAQQRPVQAMHRLDGEP